MEKIDFNNILKDMFGEISGVGVGMNGEIVIQQSNGDYISTDGETLSQSFKLLDNPAFKVSTPFEQIKKGDIVVYFNHLENKEDFYKILKVKTKSVDAISIRAKTKIELLPTNNILTNAPCFNKVSTIFTMNNNNNTNGENNMMNGMNNMMLPITMMMMSENKEVDENGNEKSGLGSMLPMMMLMNNSQPQGQAQVQNNNTNMMMPMMMMSSMSGKGDSSMKKMLPMMMLMGNNQQQPIQPVQNQSLEFEERINAIESVIAKQTCALDVILKKLENLK